MVSYLWMPPKQYGGSAYLKPYLNRIILCIVSCLASSAHHRVLRIVCDADHGSGLVMCIAVGIMVCEHTKFIYMF